MSCSMSSCYREEAAPALEGLWLWVACFSAGERVYGFSLFIRHHPILGAA